MRGSDPPNESEQHSGWTTPTRKCSTRFLVLTLLVSSGCTGSLKNWSAGGWVADYETAEQQAGETGRGMLILYQPARPDRALKAAFDDPAIKERTDDFVRCELAKSYEPDRSYVRQFGVERAPALILIHRDGTFHAQAGSMSQARILGFLSSARPPGKRPAINPYLPRESCYKWIDTLDEARQTAQRTGRPMLIVYHRRFSRDWSTIEKLLSRREAHSRFADMVHCRIAILNPLADAYISPYGAVRLPAIVVDHPHGAYSVLEMPTTLQAVVRFADSARRSRVHGNGSKAAAGP